MSDPIEDNDLGFNADWLSLLSDWSFAPCYLASIRSTWHSFKHRSLRRHLHNQDNQ